MKLHLKLLILTQKIFHTSESAKKYYIGNIILIYFTGQKLYPYALFDLRLNLSIILPNRPVALSMISVVLKATMVRQIS